jgi:chitin synthase
MSAIYAVIMMAVIVGTTIQVAEDSWTSPNAVFLMLLFSIFIIAAITHPQEFWCIVPGMLYFLTIPSGYLLLLIYSLCNLNIVSWGTREVEKKKKAKKPGTEEAKKPEPVKKPKKGFFSQFTIKIFNPSKYSENIRKFFREWLGVDTASTNNVILKQILTTLERIEKIKNDEEIDGIDLGFIAPEEIQDHKDRVNEFRKSQRKQASIKQGPLLRQRTGQSINSNNPYYGGNEHQYMKQRDELINPAWIEHTCLKTSEVDFLDQVETQFWQKLIDRYLHPLVEDKAYQAKVARDLKSLRNNGCFAFFMINALWMVIIFHLQLVQYKVRDYIYIPIPRLNYEPLRFEPLGFGFLIFFATILLVQFVSMLWHRYGTVLHLLASTDLKFCQRKFNINQMEVEDVVQTVKVLQQIKGFEEEDLPVPDYDVDPKGGAAVAKGDPNDKNNNGFNNQTIYSRARKGGNDSIMQNFNLQQQNKPYNQRQQKSQIFSAESNNTLERNLDVTSLSSKLYDPDGGASIYMPTGNASSIQTYNSNYFQSKYKLNKKHSYNKSLDVVFRRRWHALSQGKGHQIKQKPRVKVNDIFLHQVSNNIQNLHKHSKQSLRSSNDHIINIDDV